MKIDNFAPPDHNFSTKLITKVLSHLNIKILSTLQTFERNLWQFQQYTKIAEILPKWVEENEDYNRVFTVDSTISPNITNDSK
jgi:hypothetical protein